jgi:phenylalanyl-tRNA synthetase beta chain
MKFSENWLRTFVDLPLSTDELAHALTMAGLEVESIEPVVPAFTGVVVAEVLSVEKHPGRERLHVCQVNAGSIPGGGQLQIVCGAPNVQAGMRVPCALSGAELPAAAIKPTSIRGIESHGMLCSAAELGLDDPAKGLLALPEDAPPGVDFRDYYELDDKLLTLKLTPNRGDCLGLFGIAREAAAITSAGLRPLEIEPVAPEVDDALRVEVDAPAACPLYCGRVIRGVSLEDKATPRWMVRRLERSGIRTINPVVDVTNYVMLETGQPLHAFDLAKISGERAGMIQVRFARTGEKLRLLNGEELVLEPDMLVIADLEKPLALAGIMGGDESGVRDGTTDLFLESAFFSPETISGKSFRLGFSSDSAHRFERGVDFAATRTALERATRLVLEICGGSAGAVSEALGSLPPRRPINLRLQRVRQVLGVDFDEVRVAELLRRLQFDFLSTGNGVFLITPPTYRFDLGIEEDLIEELARIHGYNQIPGSLPRTASEMLPDPESKLSLPQLRGVLASRDYQEVINYAFVDASWEREIFGNETPIILKNPLSSQMSAMRSTLLGGLLSNLQFNLNRKQSRVRVFETGCCFLKEGDSYAQPEKFAGLCYGDAYPEQWGMPARIADFYDVKADIEALFWPARVHFEPQPYPALHPGKSARIHIAGVVAGYIGELHPRIRKKLDLSRSPVLFELDLHALVSRSLPTVTEISKYPTIRRDIALVVPAKIRAQAILDRMTSEQLSVISEIHLFDVYQGEGMEIGKKSLAFRVLLKDTQKTLTDAEADLAVAKLTKILEVEFGARLRN